MSNARLTLSTYATRTDARLEGIEQGIALLLAANGVGADAPAKTRKARKTVTAAPKGKAVLLRKATRKAFIAQAKREGVELAGLSTWDIAFYCVTESWAPQGFGIGERYTALAVEAGA